MNNISKVVQLKSGYWIGAVSLLGIFTYEAITTTNGCLLHIQRSSKIYRVELLQIGTYSL